MDWDLFIGYIKALFIFTAIGTLLSIMLCIVIAGFAMNF